MTQRNRVLVFGGTGFLGSRVCGLARSSDWDVHATHLTTEVESSDNAQWHRCDIVDLDSVAQLIASVQPTHIVNAAYRQSGGDVLAICAEAPQTMATAAALCTARFVHLSTDLVFDGELGRLYREADSVTPLGVYGEAKALAEQWVLDALPTASIVRTSLIYGDPNAPQEQLTQRALLDDGIAFFTDEWRTPVHVDDLAAAVLTLLGMDHAGLLHIAGDERLNRLEFARLLATALELDPGQLAGRTQDPALGPRASDVSLDTDLSISLGFTVPGPTVRLAGGYA